MPAIVLSLFFCCLTSTKPIILIDAKQRVRAVLLLRFFEPFEPDSYGTTQKFYLYHHPNDHHRHRNTHHTTYLPTPL